MKKLETIFRGGLYRSRRGIILGVCKGFADYFDFSVFWARAVTIALLIFSGFWPITALYFIAALLMKPEPVLPIHTEEEQEFYDSYVHSSRAASDRLKRRYEGLDRRIRRMEHAVTSREYDWEHRLNT
ncbi:MAG: envelope stress response membrane protein PspC [Deltaproteobacteria bacterium]|nr:envelope stress response membrane protein PspC [Deltaproteobacteria bacterium]